MAPGAFPWASADWADANPGTKVIPRAKTKLGRTGRNVDLRAAADIRVNQTAICDVARCSPRAILIILLPSILNKRRNYAITYQLSPRDPPTLPCIAPQTRLSFVSRQIIDFHRTQPIHHVHGIFHDPLHVCIRDMRIIRLAVTGRAYLPGMKILDGAVANRKSHDCLRFADPLFTVRMASDRRHACTLSEKRNSVNRLEGERRFERSAKRIVRIKRARCG